MTAYDPIESENSGSIEEAAKNNNNEVKRTRLKKIKIILSILASIATIIGVALGVYFNVNRNNNSANTTTDLNSVASANNTQTNSATPTSTSSTKTTTTTFSWNSATSTASVSPNASTICTNGGGVQVQVMQSGWCMTDWYSGACRLIYPKTGSTTQLFTSSFTNWKVGGCYMSSGEGQDTWFNVSCNNGPWVTGSCTMLYSNSKDCVAVWDDGWDYNPGTCSHFKSLTQADLN